jgi:hypothetical protein
MRDWFGETQVYVRWQKAAEEQKRFDRAKTLSCLASRDHPAPLYPLRPKTGNPEIIPAPLMGGGDLAAAGLVRRITGEMEERSSRKRKEGPNAKVEISLAGGSFVTSFAATTALEAGSLSFRLAAASIGPLVVTIKNLWTWHRHKTATKR